MSERDIDRKVSNKLEVAVTFEVRAYAKPATGAKDSLVLYKRNTLKGGQSAPYTSIPNKVIRKYVRVWYRDKGAKQDSVCDAVSKKAPISKVLVERRKGVAGTPVLEITLWDEDGKEIKKDKTGLCPTFPPVKKKAAKKKAAKKKATRKKATKKKAAKKKAAKKKATRKKTRSKLPTPKTSGPYKRRA